MTVCVRFKQTKKGVKEQPSIPKSVHLIECLEKESDDEDTDEERDSFSFSEQHIVIKGEYDLTPGHTEDEIRNELVEVFKAKISTIRKPDFDFVKCEKHVVTLPVVKTGHKWDFAHVKNLCGQGHLYVKLNVLKMNYLTEETLTKNCPNPHFFIQREPLLKKMPPVLKVTRTQYHSRPGSVEDTCMEDMQSLVEHHQVS